MKIFIYQVIYSLLLCFGFCDYYKQILSKFKIDASFRGFMAYEDDMSRHCVMFNVSYMDSFGVPESLIAEYTVFKDDYYFNLNWTKALETHSDRLLAFTNFLCKNTGLHHIRDYEEILEDIQRSVRTSKQISLIWGCDPPIPEVVLCMLFKQWKQDKIINEELRPKIELLEKSNEILNQFLEKNAKHSQFISQQILLSKWESYLNDMLTNYKIVTTFLFQRQSNAFLSYDKTTMEALQRHLLPLVNLTEYIHNYPGVLNALLETSVNKCFDKGIILASFCYKNVKKNIRLIYEMIEKGQFTKDEAFYIRSDVPDHVEINLYQPSKIRLLDNTTFNSNVTFTGLKTSPCSIHSGGMYTCSKILSKSNCDITNPISCTPKSIKVDEDFFQHYPFDGGDLVISILPVFDLCIRDNNYGYQCHTELNPTHVIWIKLSEGESVVFHYDNHQEVLNGSGYHKRGIRPKAIQAKFIIDETTLNYMHKHNNAMLDMSSRFSENHNALELIPKVDDQSMSLWGKIEEWWSAWTLFSLIKNPYFLWCIIVFIVLLLIVIVVCILKCKTGNHNNISFHNHLPSIPSFIRRPFTSRRNVQNRNAHELTENYPNSYVH